MCLKKQRLYKFIDIGHHQLLFYNITKYVDYYSLNSIFRYKK